MRVVIRKMVLMVLFFGMNPAVRAASLSEVIVAARESAVEVLVDGILKGGGAFVSDEGLVITAAHVFGSPDARFEVITAGDARLPAVLVAFDKGHDLALLRADVAGGMDVRVLEVVKKIPPVGSRVLNLGNALRNRGVVLEGMVAQEETVFNELAETHGYVENYYVSAMTPALTSGGVWINTRGQIVGVQSARLNDGKVTSGVAIVAPPGAIRILMLRKKNASTAGIGAWVWEMWTADLEFLKRFPEGTEGLLIGTLHEGGPLAAAGLKRLDVIMKCDGTAVRRRPDLMRLVRAKRPGEKVALTVLEPDVEGTKEIEVVLMDLEKVWEQRADGGE